MKSQIATTREQADRLLKCGVLVGTADMHWDNKTLDEPFLDTGEVADKWDIPAWSLSALLSLMPKVIESHSILPEMYSLLLMPKDNACMACYANKKLQHIVYVAQPIIEACVQLIEWLTANGYKLNDCPCREKGGEE